MNSTNGLARSRRAKADFIFRKMVEHVLKKQPSKINKQALFFWDKLQKEMPGPISDTAFLGESPKEFCPNDGFENAMNKAEIDNPNNYLMIPFFELPFRYQNYIEKRVEHPSSAINPGGRVELYYLPNVVTATPYDTNPGWRDWALSSFGRVWQRLTEIKSETGPDYKWP